MNKIFIILSLILLTSCEYDYIFTNPNHPQEYMGNWICDSTFSKNSEKRNFYIMQTGVEVTLTDDIHKTYHYYDFKVDKSKTIPTFILYNSSYVEIKSYKIIQEPYKGFMALKDSLNNTIYYLSK